MPEAQARLVKVRGVVQGVGFRPFVFRLARENALAGWVLNEEEGVEIHVEGSEPCARRLRARSDEFPPPAARIRSLDVAPARPEGARKFEIRASELRARPAAAISPDLRGLRALPRANSSTPRRRRYGYPYINCTDCGPRYSILRALPYDRPHTTMGEWSMDAYCATQYRDPMDRRFHAQPVACPQCGPHYYLETADALIADDGYAISETARLLRAGRDRRHQRSRRLSPVLRCQERRCRRGPARAQIPQGKTVRAHGGGSRCRARALADFSAKPNSC